MNVCYYLSEGRRSRTLASCIEQGLSACGENIYSLPQERYSTPDADVAIFYGLRGNMRQILKEYVDAGKKTLFFDLGYWGRHDGGRLSGYHRIAINDYHANANGLDYGPDRFSRFKVQLKEFDNKGDYILLCGQSAKAAWVYNMLPEEWERRTIKKIRKYTDRKIVYMPKHSWKDAAPIPDTTYSKDTLEGLLLNAKVVVSHHSNSSIHALVAGKPIITDDGIAKILSGKISDIESPRIPSIQLRNKLLWEAAYWQWSMEEITNGRMWKHLCKRGLL